VSSGDLVVVPAWECRTYLNVGPKPAHILTVLAGEGWVQFDQAVIDEARKLGAQCDDWGTLTHDLEGKLIENLNIDHRKDYRKREDFVVTPTEELVKNIFTQTGGNGRKKMPFIPEGLELEMVTVSQGASVRIPRGKKYTSIIGMEGRGMIQGIQMLGKWDTALIENVDGVSEPEV